MQVHHGLALCFLFCKGHVLRVKSRVAREVFGKIYTEFT